MATATINGLARRRRRCDVTKRWKPTELEVFAASDELAIASFRSDGTLRPYTTIRVVRIGDDLYVRSWRGRGGAWFRRALQRHEGRIRAGGPQRDIAFEESEDADPPRDR